MGTKRYYSPKEKEAIFVERIRSIAPDSWEKYCNLVLHENMTMDEVRYMNFRKRIDILRYAYDNTVFYREFYNSVGLEPGDIKSENDWDKVPSVTKDMVRERGNDMIAGGMNGDVFRRFAQMNATGGSTGRPLLVYCDKRYDNNDYWHWRHRGWWLGRELGKPLSDDVAVLGQNQAFVWRAGGLGMSDKVIARMRRIFYPTMYFYLNAQDMSEENVERFINEVNEYGVGYLHAYTGAAQQLAEEMLKGHMAFKSKPRVVSVTCTPLTEDVRKVIEAAFDAPVFDVYGCNETNWLSVGCRADKHGMHVLDDLCHIDLVNEDGKAIHDEQEGSVLATSFENRVCPFIKYALGDRTHFITAPCDCGLPFSRIASVKGRESDYLVDINGRKIFGWNASFDADEFQGCVKQFQYVQNANGEVLMKIVPNRENPHWTATFSAFKAKWLDQFEDGGRLHFIIQEVDEIPHDGGKIRFIIRNEEKSV